MLSERGNRLDLARIQETLALIEQALGQSDLQPVFESELRRRARMTVRAPGVEPARRDHGPRYGSIAVLWHA